MTEGGKPSPDVASSAPGATPAPAAPVPTQASVEDFKKLLFKVGVIVSAEDHPNADRLLVLKVDIGDGTPRQVVAGIKGSYQASDLVGQHVVVVANLKPATLRGVESQGMVLAASDGSAIVLVSPGKPIAAGSQVK
jgi:methionyl-tRNA synthetase